MAITIMPAGLLPGGNWLAILGDQVQNETKLNLGSDPVVVGLL